MKVSSNHIRRTDREETDDSFLKSLLNNSVSCSIAISTEDYPLVHVAFFSYDDSNNDIIFHFSKYGFAGQQIIDGRKACVSIYKYGKLYTADKAVDFGCEYQSVIIYGNIRIINDTNEKIEAMHHFFDKFFHHIPKSEFEDFTVTEINPIHVAKIRIDRWLGKQHLVPETARTSFYPGVACHTQKLKPKNKNMESIRHRLTIKAAPEKVYEAVTTQEGLESWWCKQTTAKPEVGFVNIFTFGNSPNEMKVTELVPNKRVAWQCINSVDEWMNTNISFDLEEKDGRTILRFAHSDWRAATDFFDACNYDWGRFMTSLKSFCETGTPS